MYPHPPTVYTRFLLRSRPTYANMRQVNDRIDNVETEILTPDLERLLAHTPFYKAFGPPRGFVLAPTSLVKEEEVNAEGLR